MSGITLEAMQDKLRRAAEAHDLDWDDGLAFRPMFGGVCAYIDGRVFASLSDIGLALKLSAEDRAALLGEPGAVRLQYEPSSPPSKQYVVVPPSLGGDGLALWVRRSVDHVRTLPAPKPRKKAG